MNFPDRDPYLPTMDAVRSSRRAMLCCWLVLAISPAVRASASIAIPRVSYPPRISDFESMVPHGAAAELKRLTGFIQQQPSDGQPATQRTEAYIGYDSSNLYVAFVCWNQAPTRVWGHLSRREPSTPFDYEDYVEITLDTFHDQRHAFVFDINPRGVQADALRTEGQGNDYSWDTVWDSWSRVTPQGYVILVAIPFRSLRFHGSSTMTWGLTLMRYLASNDEIDYWPRVSSRIAGILNQEATMSGLEGISPNEMVRRWSCRDGMMQPLTRGGSSHAHRFHWN